MMHNNYRIDVSTNKKECCNDTNKYPKDQNDGQKWIEYIKRQWNKY